MTWAKNPEYQSPYPRADVRVLDILIYTAKLPFISRLYLMLVVIVSSEHILMALNILVAIRNRVEEDQ